MINFFTYLSSFSLHFENGMKMFVSYGYTCLCRFGISDLQAHFFFHFWTHAISSLACHSDEYVHRDFSWKVFDRQALVLILVQLSKIGMERR